MPIYSIAADNHTHLGQSPRARTIRNSLKKLVSGLRSPAGARTSLPRRSLTASADPPRTRAWRRRWVRWKVSFECRRNDPKAMARMMRRMSISRAKRSMARWRRWCATRGRSRSGFAGGSTGGRVTTGGGMDDPTGKVWAWGWRFGAVPDPKDRGIGSGRRRAAPDRLYDYDSPQRGNLAARRTTPFPHYSRQAAVLARTDLLQRGLAGRRAGGNTTARG